MIYLLKQSILWYNLPYTIFLGLIIIYWITVILGLLDVEVADIEIELEGFLALLNIGSVPFSIWLSILGFQLWLYSLSLHIIFDNLGFLTTLLPLRFLIVLTASLPVAGFMTKLITSPLRKLLADSSASKQDFIGRECLITSSVVTDTFGTAELTVDGMPQIIDVRSKPSEAIDKGEKVLIFDYDKEEDLFLIERI